LTKRPPADDQSGDLFPLTPAPAGEPELKRPQNPVWTENKARLIQRYLRYFVFVTKHGTYIDGFAGAQEPDKEDLWAAKLVLESEPRWLGHLLLFEKEQAKLEQLRELVGSQLPRRRGEPKRTVEVIPGNVNVQLPRALAEGKVNQKHATFCLLDQRTFECSWRTVEAVARHKTGGYKVELFYFLANKWLDRAMAASRNTGPIDRWWGDKTWPALRQMSSRDRAYGMADRFREKLGYASVKPWPIYEREHGGAVMYYMIHATDHPEAPVLMARAYSRAVTADEPKEQFRLEYGLED
jgi:three-Cys-motif partner protein